MSNNTSGGTTHSLHNYPSYDYQKLVSVSQHLVVVFIQFIVLTVNLFVFRHAELGIPLILGLLAVTIIGTYTYLYFHPAIELRFLMVIHLSSLTLLSLSLIVVDWFGVFVVWTIIYIALSFMVTKAKSTEDRQTILLATVVTINILTLVVFSLKGSYLYGLGPPTQVIYWDMLLSFLVVTGFTFVLAVMFRKGIIAIASMTVNVMFTPFIATYFRKADFFLLRLDLSGRILLSWLLLGLIIVLMSVILLWTSEKLFIREVVGFACILVAVHMLLHSSPSLGLSSTLVGYVADAVIVLVGLLVLLLWYSNKEIHGMDLLVALGLSSVVFIFFFVSGWLTYLSYQSLVVLSLLLFLIPLLVISHKEERLIPLLLALHAPLLFLRLVKGHSRVVETIGVLIDFWAVLIALYLVVIVLVGWRYRDNNKSLMWVGVSSSATAIVLSLIDGLVTIENSVTAIPILGITLVPLIFFFMTQERSWQKWGFLVQAAAVGAYAFISQNAAVLVEGKSVVLLLSGGLLVFITASLFAWLYTTNEQRKLFGLFICGSSSALIIISALGSWFAGIQLAVPNILVLGMVLVISLVPTLYLHDSQELRIGLLAQGVGMFFLVFFNIDAAKTELSKLVNEVMLDKFSVPLGLVFLIYTCLALGFLIPRLESVQSRRLGITGYLLLLIGASASHHIHPLFLGIAILTFSILTIRLPTTEERDYISLAQGIAFISLFFQPFTVFLGMEITFGYMTIQLVWLVIMLVLWYWRGTTTQLFIAAASFYLSVIVAGLRLFYLEGFHVISEPDLNSALISVGTNIILVIAVTAIGIISYHRFGSVQPKDLAIFVGSALTTLVVLSWSVMFHFPSYSLFSITFRIGLDFLVFLPILVFAQYQFYNLLSSSTFAKGWLGGPSGLERSVLLISGLFVLVAILSGAEWLYSLKLMFVAVLLWVFAISYDRGTLIWVASVLSALSVGNVLNQLFYNVARSNDLVLLFLAMSMVGLAMLIVGFLNDRYWRGEPLTGSLTITGSLVSVGMALGLRFVNVQDEILFLTPDFINFLPIAIWAVLGASLLLYGFTFQRAYMRKAGLGVLVLDMVLTAFDLASTDNALIQIIGALGLGIVLMGAGYLYTRAD